MSTPFSKGLEADTGHSRSVLPLSEATIDKPPSCIEFVPGWEDYFEVGTYQLDTHEAGTEPTTVDSLEKEQSRSGSLRLIRILKDGAEM